MAQITDFNSPSWAIFPINGNCTAWRSYGLPIILCEPGRRDSRGKPVVNSGVTRIRVLIENVPYTTTVAGHDHVGLMYPNTEIHAVTLYKEDLVDRQIDVEAFDFFRVDGTPIDFADARLGDVFQFVTATGVRDTLTYIPSANYYDLSDIKVDTFDLPSDKYYLTYQAYHYARILTAGQEQQLVCIDGSNEVSTSYRFMLNHPGDVIDETVRLTPTPYLTSVNKGEDETIGLYRPFTDALQDIFDEQGLLEKINWVDTIRPEYVPYLSYLLGLDIPFFPGSADQLRKTMLKNVVRLQQLKGSKRAIIELFELFGFSSKIHHLYWNREATRLIRPGQSLPNSDEEVTIEVVRQIEPLLAAYDTDGFGELKVPLLFIPGADVAVEDLDTTLSKGEVTVSAFLVERDSDVHQQLQNYQDAMDLAPDTYGEENGLPTLSGGGLIGYSEHRIDVKSGVVAHLGSGGARYPFSKQGIAYDRRHNLVSLTFNGALNFGKNVNNLAPEGMVLYTYATYATHKVRVPSGHMQSNRFDIQLYTETGEPVLSNILEFLVEFLFKLKAFHSLLNVVLYNVNLGETYLVTDWCVGGDFPQRPDIDAGKLQVPPAIIPDFSQLEGCDNSPLLLGYKPEDVALRLAMLSDLAEEHAAWRALDSRAGESTSGLTYIEQPTSGDRDSCIFNPRGQDRVTTELPTEEDDWVYSPESTANSQSSSSQTNKAESPLGVAEGGLSTTSGGSSSSNNDSGHFGSFKRDYSVSAAAICDTDGVNDYCYKGRVSDETLYRNLVPNYESYRYNPCRHGIGTGVYFELPSQGGIRDLSVALTPAEDNTLGRLLRAYTPTNNRLLHYADGLDQIDAYHSDRYTALQRPELGIDLTSMHIPGCRFVRMGQLQNDYEHESYRARPWDDAHSTYCVSRSPKCSVEPAFLNATLELDEYGDEILVFDDMPYTSVGNGLEADIYTMGYHLLPLTINSLDIIHRIFSAQATGHQAISLDQLEDCSPNTESDLIDITTAATTPVFSSAGFCGTLTRDFQDGYAAEFGYYHVEDSNLDRDGLYAELFEALEIPINDATDLLTAYRMGSGIRNGQGTRLDCGCLQACVDAELPCGVEFHLDEDGYYDWNQDSFSSTTKMVITDTIGVGSKMLNGEVPSMFELMPLA